MANMRIIHANTIDSASNLTSTPACAAATPITNIQIPLRGSVARVIAPAGNLWAISGDVMGTQSGFCLVGHNLTGSATVRLRLYSDYARTICIYDSDHLPVGTPSVWGDPAASPNGGLIWGVSPFIGSMYPGTPEYFSIWFTPVTSAVSFTVNITDAGNADGYLQVGRIYLGEYWEPATNIAYGLEMGWKEASKQTRSDAGSLRSEGYLPYRVYSGNFDAQNETDRAAWFALVRKLGLRLDFLVSFAPGEGISIERDYMAACKFVTLPKTVAPDFGRYATTACTLEEI